jgi:riboflavin kinase/FMN adenylyltransferase
MDFIEQLLVGKLAISHLIVGDDFCFGKDRLGNFDMLVDAGKRFGFNVNSTQSFRLQECRISSTAIRKCIVAGDFVAARNMLGHPFSVNGTVVHGDKKGRTIGFPTANIAMQRSVSPVNGVYAVSANTGVGEYSGVANIGNRPTVDGNEFRLEVHLFEFSQQLYGQHIEVVIHHKLRDEHKFNSLEQLKAQIALDVDKAKQYFQQQLSY